MLNCCPSAGALLEPEFLCSRVLVFMGFQTHLLQKANDPDLNFLQVFPLLLKSLYFSQLSNSSVAPLLPSTLLWSLKTLLCIILDTMYIRYLELSLTTPGISGRKDSWLLCELLPKFCCYWRRDALRAASWAKISQQGWGVFRPRSQRLLISVGFALERE